MDGGDNEQAASLTLISHSSLRMLPLNGGGHCSCSVRVICGKGLPLPSLLRTLKSHLCHEQRWNLLSASTASAEMVMVSLYHL